MSLPFTTGQFFEVFATYNEAVWPAQILLTLCGATAAAAAFSGHRHGPRFAVTTLALLWLWMAFAYHAVFFVTINPIAYVFAALFVFEAVALARWSTRCDDVVRPSHLEIVTAAVLFAYALIGYPAIAFAAGQRYPSMPTFGVPCPTTIFTLGIFCLFASSVPVLVLIVPALWALIATSAALQLHVPEDFGLSAAAVVTLTLCVGSRARTHAQRKEALSP